MVNPLRPDSIINEIQMHLNLALLLFQIIQYSLIQLNIIDKLRFELLEIFEYFNIFLSVLLIFEEVL